MRINLPQCDFSDCRRRIDGNCNSKEAFRNCKYQHLLNDRYQIEKLMTEYDNRHEFGEIEERSYIGASEALETLIYRLCEE